jgi:hypothetical protein
MIWESGDAAGSCGQPLGTGLVSNNFSFEMLGATFIGNQIHFSTVVDWNIGFRLNLLASCAKSP